MQTGNCIIPAYLSLNDKGGQINLYLDTGAEVSVASVAILQTCPDDKKLGCKGTIDLLVQIGNEEHVCTFYLLASGQNMLLSLPYIKRFGLIIDTQSQLCHIRNPVDICGNVSMYQYVSSMYC